MGAAYISFDVEGPLADALEGMRYNYIDSLHLTSHFLSNVPLSPYTSGQVMRYVRQAAGRLAPEARQLELLHWDSFGRARVAVLTPNPELRLWRHTLSGLLVTAGAPPDTTYDFTEHITYAYQGGLHLDQTQREAALPAGTQVRLTRLEFRDGLGLLSLPLLGP